MRVAPAGTRTGLVTLLTLTAALLLAAAQSPLPAESLHYGRFRIQFGADGTLVIDGHEWKPFNGHWTVEGNELTVRTSGGLRDCGDAIGRYRFTDRWDEPQPGPDCRRVWQQAHGSSREHVATGGFDGAGCRAQDHSHETAQCAITAESRARGGQLAIVPWPAGRRRRGRAAPAGPVGSEHRREHPLAHADSGNRPFQSDRLGRPRVRRDGHQQRSSGDVQAWSPSA